jgi:hypothetical protein
MIANKKRPGLPAVATGEPTGKMCPQCGHEMVKLDSGGAICPYWEFSFGQMIEMGITIEPEGR